MDERREQSSESIAEALHFDSKRRGRLQSLESRIGSELSSNKTRNTDDIIGTLPSMLQTNINSSDDVTAFSSQPKWNKPFLSQPSSRSFGTVDSTGGRISTLTMQKSKIAELSTASSSNISRVKVGKLSLRKRIWYFFDDPRSSKWAYRVSMLLIVAICVSTAVFIMQTMKSLGEEALSVLSQIEGACIIIFSIEFALRALSCPNKFVFMQDIFNWIDLIAVIPFYVEQFVDSNHGTPLSIIRVSRLTRVARVFKVSRYSSSVRIFVSAIYFSLKPLSMLVFLIAIAMILFSSLLYYIELEADGCRKDGWFLDPYGITPCDYIQQDGCRCNDPNPFDSIPGTFFWCIVTMTTVGYGDQVPVTILGKLVAVLAMLSGMIIMALPISVIGTNFQRVLQEVHDETIQNSMDVIEGKEKIHREEIHQILKGFHAAGEAVHLDPDTVIQLYDKDQTGTLEEEELEEFRRDMAALHSQAIQSPSRDNRNVNAVHPETARRNSVSSFSTAPVFDGESSVPNGEMFHAIERMIDTRVLELEERLEIKLNAMMKMMVHVDKSVRRTSTKVQSNYNN